MCYQVNDDDRHNQWKITSVIGEMVAFTIAGKVELINSGCNDVDNIGWYYFFSIKCLSVWLIAIR